MRETACKLLSTHHAHPYLNMQTWLEGKRYLNKYSGVPSIVLVISFSHFKPEFTARKMDNKTAVIVMLNEKYGKQTVSLICCHQHIVEESFCRQMCVGFTYTKKSNGTKKVSYRFTQRKLKFLLEQLLSFYRFVVGCSAH